MTEHEFTYNESTARFDPETLIFFIYYAGILDGDTNVAVYDWIDEIYDEFGIENIQGQVFDFRNVEEFAPDNLKTARRNSNKMNMAHDTSHIPVGLIVSDHNQGESLRASMRISPKNLRKQIVLNEAEAMAHIKEWHKNGHHQSDQSGE